MEYKIEELHASCDRLLNDGVDKDLIIKRFQTDNIPQEQMKKVVSYLDAKIIETELLKQVKSDHLIVVFIGGVLLLMGLFITVSSYLALKNKFYFAIGLILCGLMMIVTGIKNYKAPSLTQSRTARIKGGKFRKW